MKNNTLRKNLGLYIEGLRQSKVIGIPFVCLGALMTIFDLLNELFTNTVKGPEAGFMVMLIASFAATPLMLLMLFNFLNSRKASDFYHSIPRSRRSLYLSFGAAAVTWAVVTVTAMTVLEMLVYVIFGHQLDLAMWGEVPLMMISTNILIAGGVLLAISISSTVFSQVVISGLILFLPRVLIACFEEVVTDIVPILPSFEQALGILGAPRANILIGLIAYDLSGDSLWQACLYSLAVGIAYAALGMVFFCRRKSETAALPALNRWVQTAIRVIIAFVICLLPTIELAKEINKGIPFGYISDIEMMFVFYGVAIIAYFVYEAISIRSVRGMWKSWRELLIGLGVLVALNLVFIFGAGLSAKAVLAFQPENDDVVSVSFQTDDRYNSYSELRIAETEVSDEAIKGFLASQMRKDVENIHIINESFRYDAYNGETYALYSNQVLVKFTMENGKEVTRYVYMSELENRDLLQMLLRDRDYVTAAMDFPQDYQDITLYGSSSAAGRLTDEQITELYSIYIAEAAELDPEEYLSDDKYVIADMSVDGRYKGKEYSSSYDIYLGTPKTLQAYIEMLKSDESLSDVLELMENASYYYLNVRGCNFINNGNYYESYGSSYDFYGNYEGYEDVEITTATTPYYYSDEQAVAVEIYQEDFLDSEENRSKMIAELLANESSPLDITKPFYIVNINVEYEVEASPLNENGTYNYDTYKYEDYELFIQAAEEGSCLELPEFVSEYEYYRD